MILGIIKEGKTPPDHRVPLTPPQCKTLLETYPELKIIVEPSEIRAFTDKEYRDAGVEVSSKMEQADVLMGVKEVPLEQLIAGKTYLFFSHTYKKQPYNRDLLRAVLAKKITLIDYEMLKSPTGKRLLGFGRYAGIVGAYNAFRAWGQLKGSYTLKPAHQCRDRRELEAELIKVKLPPYTRIAISGAGRVAGGAMEILSALRIMQVLPHEYLQQDYKEAVYSQLSVEEYFARMDDADFKRQDFFKNPTQFRSNFKPYAERTHLYIPCHFWSENSPFIFTREDARHPNFNIELISDVSCDIDGPIASTLRPSTIAQPFYGYDKEREEEVPFGKEGSIAVSAVDNLPCELPGDASEDFGNELIKNIMPHFFNGDKEQVLARASETNSSGELTPHFAYLEDYVNEC